MKKFAVMAVAAAAAMGAAQVQAASIIDDFTAAQVVQDLTTGDGGTWGTVPNRQVCAASIALGGCREIFSQKDGNPADDGAAGVKGQVINGAPPRFLFSEDDGQNGFTILRYDGAAMTGVAGPDFSTAILDLSAIPGGVINFNYRSDANFQIKITLWDTDGTAVSVTENAVDTRPCIACAPAFVNGFVDLSGGGFTGEAAGVDGIFDPTAVGAVEILFNLTGVTAVDLSFTGPTVPEPASIALTGLALLGAGAVRRRRKS